MNHFYKCYVYIKADVIYTKRFSNKKIKICGKTSLSGIIKAATDKKAIELFKNTYFEEVTNIPEKVNLKDYYNHIVLELIYNVFKKKFVNKKEAILIENVTFDWGVIKELTLSEASKYFTPEEIFGNE